ncbi:hypothetical protein ACQ86N_05750 [Puia sp. P3]|uniref:hypothetical protein n=1 Tax=Puia sp. P3 TaxID=3423952 RepID=UPI003D67677B
MSSNFPGTGGNVVQPKFGGAVDGFVAQISNDGSALMKASYYGTGGTDMIYGLEFDKSGFPYVTGTTTSVLPVSNSSFNSGGNQASGKQFITKFKQDLSGIVYSANFGPGNVSSPNISPTAFLVDRCENVYVAGWGGGADINDGLSEQRYVGAVGDLRREQVYDGRRRLLFLYPAEERDRSVVRQLFGAEQGWLWRPCGRGNEPV